MSWRPLLAVEECERRLGLVFPRAAFDSKLSSPLAAWAVAAMLYVDAVVPAEASPPPDAKWARPTTIVWMSDEAYARGDAVSRAEWRDAQWRGKRRVEQLLDRWGLPFRPKYADNSREGVRDETWPGWLEQGAARKRQGVKTTSNAGRWAMSDAFADLFDPQLQDGALADAIHAYRDAHMTPAGRIKAITASQRAAQAHAVAVQIPNGAVRLLEPGEASVILRGVIERWAPARLADPVVLTISEPGNKVYTADAALIRQLGLMIDVGRLLPDALLADVGAPAAEFWVIEVVASDGPIDEKRKRELVQWATQQNIPEASLSFLTAFGSRNASAARRRLKDLATGTFAWYVDEPERELAWYELRR